MRKLVIILFSLLGMVTIMTVVLVIILNTYNDEDYKQLLITTMDHFFGYSLSIDGKFDLNPSLTPSLTASGIELVSKPGSGRIEIGEFRIQLDLRHLLDGTLLINDLLVENMTVNLAVDDPQSKSFSGFSRFMPFPIIEHAEFRKVKVYRGKGMRYELSDLKIASPDKQSPLAITAKGNIRNLPFSVYGETGSLENVFSNGTDYPIDLKFDWQYISISVNGIIQDIARGEGLQLDFFFESPDITGLLNDRIPASGHWYGSGQLLGSYTEPRLNTFQTRLEHHQTLQLEARGSIDNLITLENTSIHLSGSIAEPELLQWLLPKESPAFHKLTIDTNVTKTSEAIQLEDTTLSLSSPDGLDIELSGKTQIIKNSQPFRKMDVKAKFNAATTESVKPYITRYLPELGPVTGTARITTRDGEFVLSQIDILAGQGRSTQLAAKGRYGYLSKDPLAANSRIALDLVLAAKKSSQLAALWEIQYPEIGPVTIKGRLTGSEQKTSLDKIKLHAGATDILSIQAEGKINWDGVDTEQTTQYTDITLQGSSSSFRKAFQLYGENLPDLGPAKASMRIHGTGNVLSGTDLQFRVGTLSTLLFQFQGRVEKIMTDDLYHEGIDLDASFRGKSTSALSELFTGTKIDISDIGEVHSKFKIKGTSDALIIPRLSLTAGQEKGLTVTASGEIKQIPLKKELLPNGVDINLTMTAPNTSDLSSLARTPIPNIGSLKASGRLVDDSGIYAVQNIKILTGPADHPVLQAQGTVDNILSGSGTRITLRLDEYAIARLFNIEPNPGLGKIQGTILLSDSTGSLEIEELKIKTEKVELMDLNIHGHVSKLFKTNEIDIQASITINDLVLWGELFGTELPDLGEVTATGQLQGNREKTQYKGNLSVGNSILESNLTIDMKGNRPLLSGQLSSSILYLRDFGIHPDKPPKQIKQQLNKPLFSHTPLSMGGLNKLNLDLEIQFDRVLGTEYELDQVDIYLTLENGKLMVEPAHFTFADGHVLLHTEIDATKSRPKWKLKLKGNNANLGDVISQAHVPPAIEGDLDLYVKLNSTGNSPHEIASNLNGNVELMLENGKIRKRELNLLFLNPLGWLFSHGITDNTVYISCILSRYQIEQGVAQSSLLFLDGPKLAARAQSTINLGQETIDLQVNLEKKKLLFNTKVPLWVHGNLTDPVIEQAPINSPLLKADRYLLAPATAIPEELLGTLWGYIGKKDKQNKNSACAKQIIH